MRVIRAVALGLATLASRATGTMAQEPALTRLRETLSELDANHDRVIERDEVPESGRAAFDTLLMFNRLDADKDGFPTPDELSHAPSHGRP